MPVTGVAIFHNPDCGTSRNVIRIVEAAGYRPTVVEYLKTGWTKQQLLALFAAAGIGPRDALRAKKSPAAELGLTGPSRQRHRRGDGRPPHPRRAANRDDGQGYRALREQVLDLLDRWPPCPFAKEDGELVINTQGKRVN